ncbi:MAG: 1-acyl-sn-glycerol-3-phosphate acyltransferase [Lachnospiraceae bacterium]|nr:1-acyl-sn-glycerol-3-phosphate acyltransferase [Lachnospiraceae bacterium]
MRSLLVILYLILYLIISLPLFLVAFILKKTKGPNAAHAFAQPFVNWGWRCILWLSGSCVTVKGQENIPDGPVLYISNHRSYWDIMVIYTTVRGLTGFIAKKSMGKVPLISYWMRFMHGLFLDRENIKEGLKTILQAIDYVNDDQVSIFIAPEGTRNHEDQLLPFKAGSFKIAQRTGCPIVPVVNINTDGAYELHRPWVRPAKMAVIYGEPIYMDQLEPQNRKHIAEYVQGIIQKMYDENKHLGEE